MGEKEGMGERSLQKKQFILEKAREVFVEKGFRSVTMKDIVDACEISRGGLYLYFSLIQNLTVIEEASNKRFKRFLSFLK